MNTEAVAANQIEIQAVSQIDTVERYGLEVVARAVEEIKVVAARLNLNERHCSFAYELFENPLDLARADDAKGLSKRLNETLASLYVFLDQERIKY